MTADGPPRSRRNAFAALLRRALARLRSSAAVQEARSLPTVLLVLWCVFIGVPMVIWLTPDQQVTVAGQPLSVGARDPDLSLYGPAQLVQIGNTEFDIPALRGYGPLRPQLTLGPVRRDAAAAVLDPETGADARAAAVDSVGTGFVRWYGWATLILLGFVVATTAAASCARMLVTLRRLSRGHGEPVTMTAVWRRSVRQITAMVAIAVAITMSAWAVTGALAYDGAARGLHRIRSLSDLVGTYHFSPSPAGPKVRGYTGAVLGDSRAARVGGPPPAEATPDDLACGRSADSLATEIGNLTASRALNLACSGASIAQGLRGPQQIGDRSLPPQVGRLKQVDDLRYVVVVIGPNDLYWADFLRYCYGVDNCQDNLTQGEFAYRLAAFDREYGELLRDLDELDSNPQIVVMSSYDVFKPDAKCPDTRGPAHARGLSAANLRLLADLNKQLNEVLATGAKKYRYAVATPRLAPLCEPRPPELGPDLQGLADGHPFHPTAVGTLRMAAAAAQVIGPQPGG